MGIELSTKGESIKSAEVPGIFVSSVAGFGSEFDLLEQLDNLHRATGKESIPLGEAVAQGNRRPAPKQVEPQLPAKDKEDDRGWFLQQQAQSVQLRSLQLNERAISLCERARTAQAAAPRRFSRESLGRDSAVANMAAAEYKGPVQRLRKSLFAKLCAEKAQLPRKPVKRTDHLALDRGALDLTGEVRPSEIDTPTFGNRSSFGVAVASSGSVDSVDGAAASGEDERLLMPPPSIVPDKKRGGSAAASSGGGLAADSAGAGLFGMSGLFSSTGEVPPADGGAGGLFGGSLGSSLFGTGGTPAAGVDGQSAGKATADVAAGAIGGAPAQGNDGVKQAYKERMIKIYQQHNPSKLNEIDTLMAKYVGNEHVMYLKICNKYKVQPEPEIKPAAAGLGSALGAPAASASSGGVLFGSAGLGSALGAPAASASSGGGLFGSAGGTSGGASLFGAPSSGGASSQAASSGGLFGAPSAASATGPVDVKQAYRERMIKIYQQHNPSKVSEIDSLMGKYVGQEHTMYLKICKKYNVQPEPEISQNTAAPTPGLGITGGGASGGGLFGGGGTTSSLFGGGGGASSGGSLFGGGGASSGSLFGQASSGGALGGSFLGGPTAGTPSGGLFGGPAAAGTGQVDRKQAYRERMIKIYQQHNPSKVGEIDVLMGKYVGQEHTMYLKICKKYNVQPEPEISPGAGAPSPGLGNTGGGLFGGGTGAAPFGGAASSGLFGGGASSTFGAPHSSGGGMFGGGASASPFGGGASGGGLFGGGAAASPFGASSGGGLFGGGASASPFGGATSGGGLFGGGASASPFGGGASGGLFSQAAAGGAMDVKQAYRERMIRIYQQHNPSKLNEIDQLMGKYVGQEHVMYLKICNKYKVQPEPEIRPGGVGLPQGGAFGAPMGGAPMGGAPLGGAPMGGAPMGGGFGATMQMGGFGAGLGGFGGAGSTCSDWRRTTRARPTENFALYPWERPASGEDADRAHRDASYYWWDYSGSGQDSSTRQLRKPQEKGPVFPQYDMMVVGEKPAKPEVDGGQANGKPGEFVKVVQKLTNNLRKAEQRLRKHAVERTQVDEQWGTFQQSLKDAFMKERARYREYSEKLEIEEADALKSQELAEWEQLMASTAEDDDMGLAGFLAGALGDTAARQQAAQKVKAVLESRRRRPRDETPPRKPAAIPPVTPPAPTSRRRSEGQAREEDKQGDAAKEDGPIEDPYMGSPGVRNLLPSPVRDVSRQRAMAARTPLKAQGRKPQVPTPSSTTSLADKLAASRAAILAENEADMGIDSDEEEIPIDNLRAAAGPPPAVEID
eukprot:s2705_g3.t2